MAIALEGFLNTVNPSDQSSVSINPHPPKTPPRTGIEARRERQRQEARRAILDATQTLMAESEDCEFSIRSLAERCGYSAPTVYYHFGDKDGLRCAVLDDGMQTLVSLLDAGARDADPQARLRSILVIFIRFAMDNPTFSGLWGTVSRQPGIEMPPSVDAVKQRLDAPVAELIESGRLPDYDTESAEQVLWAMLHGLIAIQTAEPDHPWAPGLVERAVDSLLRGMTAADPAAPAGGSSR